MSDEHADQLAVLKANIDQAIASTGELAAWLHAFYVECVKQGFTADQSMTLVREQLRGITNYRSDE